MATNYTPTKFSVQQVFEILLQSPENNEIIAYLDDIKSSNLMNEAELVYPTGSRGNVYIGGAWGHSRRARIEVQKATWNTQVLAAQVGTEVIVGSNKDTIKYEILTVDNSDEATTTFKALGTVGAEIGFVYVVRSDGTYSDILTQDAVVAAGKFTYTPGSKKITFNTGELAEGTKIAVAYKFDSGASAQTISVEADKFPSTANATAFAVVKDLCTGSLYQAEIKGLVQIDPNWNWELGADSEPAVEGLNLEFVKGCVNKTLYDIIVYNEADAT